MANKIARTETRVETIYLFTCPHCDCELKNENGDNRWFKDQLPNWFECEDCGKDSEVPADLK